MITQKELHEKLHYCGRTGIFTWKVSDSPRVYVGKTAGALKKGHGYILIRVKGVLYRAHRLAWLYVYGDWPEFEIDHINHDRKDNRIENLRDVDHKTNMNNRKKSNLKFQKNKHKIIYFGKTYNLLLAGKL